MTVDEVISMAGRWQESASHDGQDLEAMANRFSFVIVALAAESDAVHRLMTEALGYEDEPLYQRVERLVRRWR